MHGDIVNNFSPKIVDSTPQSAGVLLETEATGDSSICNSTKSCGVLKFGSQMADSDSGKCDVGVAGLGGMGARIARSISSHLFHVGAWDSRPQGIPALTERLGADQLLRAETLPELAGLLRRPRTIFIFGQTAARTDAIIDELLPHLTKRDLLIDAGDSHFKDAARRARKVSERSAEFMCLGIAGGDAEAQQGVMLMAGGPREAYARTRPLLEALAHNVNGEPSVGYLGSPAAACFARMVHAGIEHGLMQLVSEAFDLMERTFGLSGDPLHGVSGVLDDYLAEVSGHLFNPVEAGTERRRIKEKLEALRNNPESWWIAQSARDLGVAMPTIDAALGALDLSARERQRSLILTPFRHPTGRFGNDAASVQDELVGALHAAMIITYAEGFALLAEGSARHRFDLDLVEIARIWNADCGARGALLEDIAAALRATPSLGNLLCDEDIAEKVMARQECLRRAVWRAGELDAVAPGMLASLDYLDSCRDAWLPVNLVQVQRDGTHRGAEQEREVEETVAMRL
jgi:6-phosphogluconate dehydrogenase